MNQKYFFWDILSSFEKEKASRYVTAYDQDQWIVTRGLLRVLLGNLLCQSPTQLDLRYSFLGKPILNCNHLHFSLSHSKNHVVYAFSKNRLLGIDIEYQNEKLPIEKLAKRYFSSHEYHTFNTLQKKHQSQAFFKGWIQKEAIVKLLGLGLHLPFKQVEVEIKKANLQCISLPLMFRSILPNILMHPISMPQNFKGVLAIYPFCNKKPITFKQFEKLNLICNKANYLFCKRMIK